MVVFAALATGACAHNVTQDKHSGSDGRTRGARPMVMNDGEARATGIVTYPGGDRVDWKRLELPAKKTGKLELELAWTPPRPGLQLGFDVLDEWNAVVASSVSKQKRSRGRTRRLTIDDARGTYYVRVYAIGRGDAGKYRLTADFQETFIPELDVTKLDIPDPPRLAEVPGYCDDSNFDPRRPECGVVCPSFNAPPNWAACAHTCPNPPDINKKVCQDTMPCPQPPDRRVASCRGKFPRCPDARNPDPNNPNCDHAKVDPVKARLLKSEVQGADVLITISAGSDAGIEKGWKGQILRGDSNAPLEGGELVVIRVEKRWSLAKVRLTVDRVTANPTVLLSPP